jgi:O-antigen/teichoic acid export membrane protein
LSSNIAVRLLSFIQATLLIRHFGPADYGLWRTAFVFPAMFAVLLEFGVHSYFLREIAKNKQAIDNYLFTIIIVKVTLTILFMGLVQIFVRFAYYPMLLQKVVTIISVSIILDSFTQLIIAIFRGCRIFWFEAVINFITQTLLTTIVIIGIYLKIDLGLLAKLFVMVSATMCLVSCAFFYKRIGLKEYSIIPYPDIINLLKRSSPFLVLGIIVPIYFDISTLVLSKLSNFADVGMFNAAYRIIFVLMLLPISLYTVFFSNLTEIYSRSKDEFTIFIRGALKYMCLFAFPLLYLTFIYSDIIIPTLFGSKYGAAVMPLRIMSVAVFFSFISSVFSVSLIATMNEKKSILVLFIATVINVFFNIMLISKYSVIGASIAITIAEMVRLIGNGVFYKRSFGPIGILSYIPKILLASTLSIISIVSIKNMSPVIAGIVGIILYFITISTTGIFNVKEIKQTYKS